MTNGRFGTLQKVTKLALSPASLPHAFGETKFMKSLSQDKLKSLGTLQKAGKLTLSHAKE